MTAWSWISGDFGRGQVEQFIRAKHTNAYRSLRFASAPAKRSFIRLADLRTSPAPARRNGWLTNRPVVASRLVLPTSPWPGSGTCSRAVLLPGRSVNLPVRLLRDFLRLVMNLASERHRLPGSLQGAQGAVNRSYLVPGLSPGTEVPNLPQEQLSLHPHGRVRGSQALYRRIGPSLLGQGKLSTLLQPRYFAVLPSGNESYR